MTSRVATRTKIVEVQLRSLKVAAMLEGASEAPMGSDEEEEEEESDWCARMACEECEAAAMVGGGAMVKSRVE